MPSRDEEVRALRQSIIESSPDPARDPADVAQLEREAIAAMVTGVVAPPQPQMRVRFYGEGIPGHDVAVDTATQILGSLQSVVTAVGEALRRAGQVTPPKRKGEKQRPVRELTQLRLAPTIGAGSVVFFLHGEAEQVSGDEIAGTTRTDTFLDVTVRDLFALLSSAEADTGSPELGAAIQRLGPRVASRLNALAGEAIDSDVDLDIGWRSPSGRRQSAQMARRGARAIQDAIKVSKERTVREQFVGILHTVSDGTDLLRLTPEDAKPLRMTVDPDIGIGLGGFLGKRVSVTVETTITWHMATGVERRGYRLVAAELAGDAEVPQEFSVTPPT